MDYEEEADGDDQGVEVAGASALGGETTAATVSAIEAPDDDEDDALGSTAGPLASTLPAEAAEEEEGEQQGSSGSVAGGAVEVDSDGGDADEYSVGDFADADVSELLPGQPSAEAVPSAADLHQQGTRGRDVGVLHAAHAVYLEELCGLQVATEREDGRSLCSHGGLHVAPASCQPPTPPTMQKTDTASHPS